MRLHGAVVAVLALAGIAAPAFGQVTFDRKYAEETKFVTHSQLKSDQTLSVAGQDVVTKSSTFEVQHTTIGKRQADGSLNIVKKAETLQAEFDIAGNKVQFDSGNPDKKADNAAFQPILDALKASLKAPVIVVLNKSNEVQEVKLDPQVVEGLPESYKANATPGKLKERVNQELEVLPKKAVKPGDVWELTQKMPLDGSQTLEFTTEFTYTGPVDKDGKSYHRIAIKHKTVKYEMAADPQAQVQIPKSDLKVTESTGEILFDAAAGRVYERSSKVRIQGDMTLVIATMNLPGKLDLTIDAKETIQP